MTSVAPPPKKPQAMSSPLGSCGLGRLLNTSFLDHLFWCCLWYTDWLPNSFTVSRFEALSWTTNMSSRNCSLVNRLVDVLAEEGLFTSCSRQSFPIVLFHLHFLALGWTDLESDNCIKFRHIQTTFLPKIRFICVEVFLKIEVNQIGSTFHSCEPNWVPHWYLSK